MALMTEVTLLTPDKSKPNVFFAPPMGLHPGEAVAYLNRLVKEPALLALVRPLLERESEDWYVAHRWKAPDGSYSLQVFVWPPGTATRIHDHASWGAYCCALGTIFEGEDWNVNVRPELEEARALRSAYGSGEDWNQTIWDAISTLIMLRPTYGSGEDWSQNSLLGKDSQRLNSVGDSSSTLGWCTTSVTKGGTHSWPSTLYRILPANYKKNQWTRRDSNS